MRPKGKPSELEARRLEAIALLTAGKKSSEVARLVGASASSVKRWRDALRQGGPDALKAKRHPGRTPRMTKAQKAELNLLLACGPRAAGYASDHWTSPQVREMIQRHFGVAFHVGYVWQILRDLGWSKPANGSASRIAADGMVGERTVVSGVAQQRSSAVSTSMSAVQLISLQPAHDTQNQPVGSGCA
jgi:transposase